ncbi:uncharacterized protein RG961_011530 isoform 4-T4 [Leptosomus discolor]
MNHVGQYWKVFLAEVSLRHFLEEGCLTKRKFLCPCLIYVLQTRVIVGEGCLLELQVSGHLVTPAFMRQCDGVDTPGWGPGLASIPPTPHTSTAPGAENAASTMFPRRTEASQHKHGAGGRRTACASCSTTAPLQDGFLTCFPKLKQQ